MKSLQKPKWLFPALLAGIILLAVAGVALLGIYLYLTLQPKSDVRWTSPLGNIQSRQVAPELAVLTLAGENDDRVIHAALDAGETETAYASIAYSLLLPDAVRSGHWLLLAERYRQSEPGRSAMCSLVALDHAALSPALGDIARGRLFAGCARLRQAGTGRDRPAGAGSG